MIAAETMKRTRPANDAGRGLPSAANNQRNLMASGPSDRSPVSEDVVMQRRCGGEILEHRPGTRGAVVGRASKGILRAATFLAILASSRFICSAATAESAGLLNDWLRRRGSAATAWDVGGQFRTRYEMRDNAGPFPNRDFLRRLDSSADCVLFRAMPHVGYTAEPWLRAFVEGRDAHELFDQRRPSPDNDELDLHQAFVILGDSGRFPLTAKLGRQELTYGDERFIGVSDWSNTRRSFDAAKLRYENEAVWVDAFAGRVVIPYDDHFNVANDYDWIAGVYASLLKAVPWQQTEVFFLSRNTSSKSPNAIDAGVGGPAARDLYTPGLRLRSSPGQLGGWEYGAEVAGQFGSVNSGGRRLEQKALAAIVLTSYTWTTATASPRVGVEYDYASGDHDGNDGTSQTFQPLFGTNHRLYGAMDLFGLRNLHIPSLSLTLKLMKPVTMRLEYLVFSLADTHDFLYPESGSARNSNGYGRHPRFSSFVGSELDLVASYQPAPWSELQCGYGHFFVGDYLRESARTVAANGGAIDANWVYLQAKLTF